jgi:acetyltransferase
MKVAPADPSYDVFHGGPRALDAVFSPRSIAVIGATDRPSSVGRTLLLNLISSPFGGTVYPVNPKRTSVLGIRAYATIADVPDAVDLAVIATPAASVPAVMQECAASGVRAAIIISAGFRETGEEGAELESNIRAIARSAGMRVIGPNCLGVMRPVSGLNATFAGRIAKPGSVAFISQSGALLTSILDWSVVENVGFSAFVSIGSMADVGWGDLISHFGDDHRTHSIVLYMESIGDARGFLSAAREVALRKPIIVIKAGRTEAAARAAVSHTGTLAGSDDVLNAAFRRSGVVRVEAIADLFYLAEVLSKQPRPAGNRLTIVTNAGGPGVLATDALILGGGKLAELSDESRSSLDSLLPAHWSRSNPVDVLGDAGPEAYAKSVEILRADPGADGVLVVLTPQAMTHPTDTARSLAEAVKGARKPVLASWMGGESIAAGERILNEAGIPTFAYPDTAARVFNYMWRYNYNLRGIYETPVLADSGGSGADATGESAKIIESIRNEGRTLLTEFEAKRILDLYDVPTVETRRATSVEDAIEAAHAIGYPVVLKLDSRSITHKTDVDGVHLNLESDQAVEAAFARTKQGACDADRDGFDGVTVQAMVRRNGYELIIGSSLDEQFGPVLLFGAGGTLVEVYKDRALGLPPLTTTLARRMMEQTRIYEALKGIRGRAAVSMEMLEQLLVRFSRLVVEQRWIREIDINPLHVDEGGAIALDARMVLHPPETGIDDLPRLAIRPYPQQYVGTFALTSGEDVMIRPIRPEDEPMLVEFHQHLSEHSVYMRYAGSLKLSQRVSHDRLARMCFIDYDREMALVVERGRADGTRQIIAVGRLTRIRGTDDGEFAMVIRDDMQRQGIGKELLSRLLDVGRAEGMRRVIAEILAQNAPMQHVCQSLGFEIDRSGSLEDGSVIAVKAL